MEFRNQMGFKDKSFMGLGLTSRKNLCVHPTVSRAKGFNGVDIGCKTLTAQFVREKAKKDPTVRLCNFFEKLENADDNDCMPAGVYTLEDLKDFSRESGYCPYFLARRVIGSANVVGS